MSYVVVAVVAYFVGEFRVEVWGGVKRVAKWGWDKLNTMSVLPPDPPTKVS